MCQRCNSYYVSLTTARLADQRLLQERVKERQLTRIPRTMLYGLFSEQFVLLDKRYCWVNKNGRLSLVPVTWTEDDEEGSADADE